MSKFDFNKISDFNKHINLSIPNYKWLVDEIVQFSKYFIDEDTNVYDLGCSTGTLLNSISKKNGARYFGIDNSNLLPKSKYPVEFIDADVRKFEQFHNASFITSIFTLQFLPRKDRGGMILKVRDALNSGGAFVVCEKTYSKTAHLQDIVNSKYYEFKEKNFPVQEILSKERQLRESLRLQSLDKLMEELSVVGDVDVFWRSYNFVGLIAIKR